MLATMLKMFKSDTNQKFSYIIFIKFLLFCHISLTVSWGSSDFPNTPAYALSEDHVATKKSWYKEIEAQWGGHVKVHGKVSWPDNESFFQSIGTDPCYDGHSDLRLKSKLFFSNRAYFEIHYETILSGGDTRLKENELEQLYPGLFKQDSIITGPINDDRRLMNLTNIIDEDTSYLLYHRLDRFSLTLQPEWGIVRIGRQALTWGNGFLFNPMDLFNPFSPTDIKRDYKIGDDMITTQFSVNKIGDFQFLYVPRRDHVSRDINWDQSSVAGKLHFFSGTTEFDIMGSTHYRDEVVGFGCTGYLGNTAWRLDATWTFLHEDNGEDDFLSMVANMDYSWIWWGKNFYGFIEFYFNGLGNNRYTEAYLNADITERFNRGEMFTFGRTYLSGEIQVELHPLFRAYLTIINNMADPSGTIQPRAIRDIMENIQLTLGGNIYYGKRGTELGGFNMPETDFLYKSPDSAYIWLTYFF